MDDDEFETQDFAWQDPPQGDRSSCGTRTPLVGHRLNPNVFGIHLES